MPYVLDLIAVWLGAFCVGFACSACVCAKLFTFLPQSKDVHVCLTGDPELAVDVNVSVTGCLSASKAL